ncbi:putative 2-aminoethylphosphonate ABC transporter substrate-binding protein [Desulfolutivibrio sulfoxidireducens]|nr:putative 2-aminoethylphosphonate ABC transporter substrate-binding protein [Desulfolutivibrio sulfoxidireducens]QLA21625.1 putative 2-aminoethylphosphonate ABC transporter substrate-binding protein [Desulfolutivibrio sulfoxidireducens]
MANLVFGLVAALALVFPNCARAGEILVYTALEDDEYPGYLELFKKEHPGITVKVVRDSTGIVTAKLLAEKDNPQADVVWGTAATSLLVCDQNGMLEGYAPKNLDKVASQFRDAANPPHWVGIKAWETGFCVNTVESEKQKLPIPASMSDLIKPEYRGKIVMPNPASSGTGFLTVSAILQTMGEDKGWQFLDKLHDNIALYTHSGSKPCKMAGAGEFPIGISFGYRGIIQKQKGEPVDTVFPADGCGWDVEANALIKKAAVKPEAKVFLDWALGGEVMKMYAKVYPLTAYPTGVAIPEGYPADPFKILVKNDFQWAAKNRDRILEEWSKRYGSKSEPKK